MLITIYIIALVVCLIGLLYNTNKLYEKDSDKVYEKDSDKGYRLALSLTFFMLGIFSLAILHHLH